MNKLLCCGFFFLVILFLSVCEVSGSTTSIVSAVPWYDTEGNRIEAHGMGWTLVGKTYYWYGESKKTSNNADHGVNCYSSTDLYNWKFEGQVLAQQDIKGVSVAGPYIVERPKVIFNSKTQMYVMWFHLDTASYALRSVGIAVSKTPNGHFTFVRGFLPDGLTSLDQTVYQDDNGDAYHIRSVANQYLGISKLTDDYMNTTGIISRTADAREGPAMFKYEGIYYLVTSHLTGWAPNPMDLLMGGKELKGATWATLGNPTGDSTSFDSQSADVLIYKNTIIYQGDRWNEAGHGGLLNATYIWLPMVPSGNSFKINWQSSWKLP